MVVGSNPTRGTRIKSMVSTGWSKSVNLKGYEMIILKIKPSSTRSSHSLPETSTYIFSGITNWRLTARPNVWRPPTDVYETEDKFIVRLEIAGVKEADFTITLDMNILTISGLRSDNMDHKSFHQMEIHFGEFYSEIELPGPIENDLSSAEYRDGFLFIYLPKAQSKNITIKDQR
jgi:HSP20 family protein